MDNEKLPIDDQITVDEFTAQEEYSAPESNVLYSDQNVELKKLTDDEFINLITQSGAGVSAPQTLITFLESKNVLAVERTEK
jgi:hypothetical protein